MRPIDNCPTITLDTRPVIYCKDCKHYEWERCQLIAYIMDGYYRNTYEVRKPDDFCSLAERRENNAGD